MLDPVYEAAYDKAYYESHKEEIGIQKKRRNIENKEHIKEYRRIHRAHITETHRKYVRANHDKVAAYNKIWEDKNRPERNEQARIHGNKRRAQKAGSGGKVTKDDIRTQFKRQKGKCYYCGNPAGEHYHADHVVPLSRGGANIPENIVIACQTCNSRKNAKLPHEWAEGGRLL
jgi:5-methylcytosine-specific restriction endonuclease McrA